MDSRVPLIAGNWKMHKTPQEAVESARQLVSLVGDLSNPEVMIAPTAPCLVPVSDALAKSNIKLGAQNMYWEEKGAYTGEVSAAMLLGAGCQYVILGHSERRQFFGETDQTVNLKTKAALGAGLVPVVCIGESKTEREEEKTYQVLDKQLKEGLKDVLPLAEEKGLVIAYEPVWAIGTGLTASADQAQEAHDHIRQTLEQILGKNLAKSTRVLYGGSVKPNNASELMGMPDIDGALVGGASLDAETFSGIVRF